MTIRFIRSSEKKQITQELENQFGITKLPYLLFGVGKEKIRGFSGSLSKEEIAKFARIANVELIGLYLMKKEHDFRLNIDALHLLKEQISKNIVEIDEEQYNKWMHGHDLEIPYKQGETVVIKFGDDFIGCGRSNGNIIFNYVPKDRRLKN